MRPSNLTVKQKCGIILRNNEGCGVNCLKKARIICLSLLLGALTICTSAVAFKEMKEADSIDIKNLASSLIVMSEHQTGNIQEENWMPVEMEFAQASIQMTPIELYDSMSIAEREAALYAGTLHMEYSGLYTYSGDRLSVSRGALYFNGHKETYYSERVLPGTSLNIPGRHVAEDGTIRDGDGYICVAADGGYMPKGSILITSLGPAKVYDSGCAYGIIDIYVNW